MPLMPPCARRSLAGCSLAALLAACVATPNLGPKPELATLQGFQTSHSFTAPVVDWPSDRWWEGYRDAQLTALIDEALAGSPTLAVAAARVHRAQGQAQQAGAARY